MILNKFPILLTTTQLETALKIFLVCCILHNLCIDERLGNADDVSRSFPAVQRYVQRSDVESRDILTEDEDFEYVHTVNEIQAEEMVNAGVSTGPNSVPVIYDGMSAKDKQMYRIAELGYVRPQVDK